MLLTRSSPLLMLPSLRPSMAPAALDVAACRAHFPALHRRPFIYADNAGGSQCLAAVAASVADYLLHTNVQHGAAYAPSPQAMQLVSVDAPLDTAHFMGATKGGKDTVIFGSNSTTLCYQMAEAMEEDVEAGQHVVLSLADHETNIGPWLKLAKRKGLVVKWWKPSLVASGGSNPFEVALQPKDLEPLLSSQTRFVAFTACSNILGHYTDIKTCVDLIRSKCKRVQICVDCVAFAPHRRMDVEEWGVDFAFFSWYKVYGPHVSVMYASLEAQKRLQPISHFFIDSTSYPYKFQPGGPNYELTASTRQVIKYIKSLSDNVTRPCLWEAFAKLAVHDETLTKYLIDALLKWKSSGLRIVGPESSEEAVRGATVSFVVVDPQSLKSRIPSRHIVESFDQTGHIGVRFGSFYAVRLFTEVLKMDPQDGVVRISLVHYNTIEEVKEIVRVLDKVLKEKLAENVTSAKL